MKPRAAFLLTLLLLAQALQPGAWAFRALMPEESRPDFKTPAVCAQPEQKESCCEVACACCPEQTPEPAKAPDCSCEASPAEPGIPATPAGPPPAPARDGSPPVLTEWRSPAPPHVEPANEAARPPRADFEKAAPRAAGKVRACVRHCALLI